MTKLTSLLFTLLAVPLVASASAVVAARYGTTNVVYPHTGAVWRIGEKHKVQWVVEGTSLEGHKVDFVLDCAGSCVVDKEVSPSEHATAC